MKLEPNDDRTIAATRIFNAPRELVWQAWTDPQHVVHWWGPRGFTNTIHKMDVRPGGVWRLTMHGPDGVDYPNIIEFLEVKKPERLVYMHGSGDGTTKFHVTITFDDAGGKTRLSLVMLFPSAEERKRVADEFGAVEGLRQTLDRLEEHVTTKGVL
jgi:uncharacterized protein YndB with AHSA1/START domain